MRGEFQELSDMITAAEKLLIMRRETILWNANAQEEAERASACAFIIGENFAGGYFLCSVTI